MKKEEYEKIIKNLNKDATHLLELHKKDKEKIEKAIEYINKEFVFSDGTLGEADIKLLQILKGEPNE